MIAEHTTAPDFTLKTDEGKELRLSSLRGRNVVLYFYPKDDTPGCTVEACELRDAFPRFSKTNAVILGVSPDSVASHQKFKTKFELPFTLSLADNERDRWRAHLAVLDSAAELITSIDAVEGANATLTAMAGADAETRAIVNQQLSTP